jgi:hypothetical protein
MKPRIIVEQKITAFTNQYRVFGANEDGSKASLIAFAQQKRLAFKEKVSFYSDETKQNLVFTFRAEKVMDIHGKYFVEDPAGNQVGTFKKDFAQSLVSSTWHILDANDTPSLIVSESNQTLAIIRRYGSFIPIVGDIIELVTAFLKYHFVFKKPGSEAVSGTYIKTTLFRDHYLLAMNDEAWNAHDWRVLAAMAVALDALQSR